MRERSGQAHVGSDQVADVRAREPRYALLLQLIVVDGEVGVEDTALVVDIIGRAVGGAVEEELREEGEVLRSPYVVVVQSHEQDDAAQVADAAVRQRVQWHPQGRAQGGNVLPVERD